MSMDHVPLDFPGIKDPLIREWGRRMAMAINRLINGGGNAGGQFTLTASSTTTTITDDLVSASSVIVFTATTATAQAAIIRVSSKANGSFVLTHDSTADTDRTFDYIVASS